MISKTNTSINTKLNDKQVYQLGNLLLEAIFSFKEGWTLMLLTESGYHVPKLHRGLVAFRLRPDGLWDTVYDCQARGLFGWKKWRFINGETKEIDLRELRFVAETRSVVKADYQEQETDRKFREIMAEMAW